MRAPLAKRMDDDLEEEEDDYDASGSVQQQPQSQSQSQEQQDVAAAQASAVALALQAPTHMFQRRRSSIVTKRNDELSDALSVIEAGDDKSLRPRFLKERSATHAHLPVTPPEAMTIVPQSKAGAFLLSVMAKARGNNLYDMRRAPFEAHRNASTNNLSYANRKKEQGVPLRVASSSNRRVGVLSGNSSRSLLADLSDETKTEEPPQERRAVEALVQDLSLQRQQIHRQLDVLHEILQRLTDAEHDRPAQAQLCKQLVDANFIKEVVSSLREFRFHVGLQVRLSTE